MKNIKGSYITHDGKAQIDFGIAYLNGYPEFSASGHFNGSCGQCIDEIVAAYPHTGEIQTLSIWHRDNHLKRASRDFIDVVSDFAESYPFRSFYDTQAETFLKRNGLTFRAVLKNTKAPEWDTPQPLKKCDKCKGRGERFSSWPDGHHQTTWEKQKGKNMPVYTLCEDCHGKGEVPDLETPKHGNHYRVTFSRAKPAQGSGQPSRITFDYWGSIKDKADGTHPTAYDVLACISGDLHAPETFEDFCAEYGEDPDSRKACATWKRCLTFSRRLKAFFTPEEQEQLSEIQ